MTTLLPGAHEAITHASTIAQVAAVTTKTGRYSTELLEHFNLMQYFKALIGREDVTHPKPHPEPIQTALAKLKDAKPDHTYMIGDTTMDLLSAQAAGVHAVAVTCGYGRKEELAHYAKLIEPSALEAVKRIQKLYDRGAYQP
jgi:phosphoglycolate phosphatase